MITTVIAGKSQVYQLGDVVRLKSGGPPMTITGFTQGGRWGDRFPAAICQWVVTRFPPTATKAEHVIGCRSFDVAMLTKEPSDQVF